jgi:hypothetical protein
VTVPTFGPGPCMTIEHAGKVRHFIRQSDGVRREVQSDGSPLPGGAILDDAGQVVEGAPVGITIEVRPQWMRSAFSRVQELEALRLRLDLLREELVLKGLYNKVGINRTSIGDAMEALHHLANMARLDAMEETKRAE